MGLGHDCRLPVDGEVMYDRGRDLDKQGDRGIKVRDPFDSIFS
jgi:hypothetical protein